MNTSNPGVQLENSQIELTTLNNSLKKICTDSISGRIAGLSLSSSKFLRAIPRLLACLFSSIHKKLEEIQNTQDEIQQKLKKRLDIQNEIQQKLKKRLDIQNEIQQKLEKGGTHSNILSSLNEILYYKNNKEKVEKLLGELKGIFNRQKVNVNDPLDSKDRSPILWVIHNESRIISKYVDTKNLISLFIENGANVDQLDRDGNSPLASAIDTQKPEIAEMLIYAGADCNKTTRIRGFEEHLDQLADDRIYGNFLKNTILKKALQPILNQDLNQTTTNNRKDDNVINLILDYI